jgi:hypothetical protein
MAGFASRLLPAQPLTDHRPTVCADGT